MLSKSTSPGTIKELLFLDSRKGMLSNFFVVIWIPFLAISVSGSSKNHLFRVPSFALRRIPVELHLLPSQSGRWGECDNESKSFFLDSIASLARGGARSGENADVDEESDEDQSDDEEDEEEDEESEDEEEESDEEDDENDGVQVETKVEKFDDPIVPSPMSSMYASLGVMLLAKKVDLVSPKLVKIARFLYIGYIITLQLFLVYVRFKAQGINDLTQIEMKSSLSSLLESQLGGPDGGDMGAGGMVKNIASSFLSSKSTVLDYDLQQANGMQRGLIFGMLFMWYLHFKMEQVQPLWIQSLNGFMNIFYSPLFQVYVLGRNLERPFQSAGMKQLEDETETAAQQESTPFDAMSVEEASDYKKESIPPLSAEDDEGSENEESSEENADEESEAEDDESKEASDDDHDDGSDNNSDDDGDDD